MPSDAKVHMPMPGPPFPVRLGLLAPGPAYYQVPLYRRLAADTRVDFTALFASAETARPYDAGYGEPVDFGVDLLAGYRSSFLRRAGSTPPTGSFWALRDTSVITVLRRARFEVLWLHGYNFALHVLAALVQRRLGGRLAFREEQTLLHPRPAWKAVGKALGLRVLFRDSAGLYIGTENRRWFEHYGIKQESLFFTPYCVDNERLEDAAARLRPQAPKLRREFGIRPDSGPVILTVSRLVRNKQPRVLLTAFEEVRRSRPCNLLVVGAGEEESALRAAVTERGIPDVHFAGFLDQTRLPRAHACADIFALASSLHETWGLVVNEAMSVGLPVVVSDKVGAATDLVAPGRNGFVCSHRQPREFAAAFRELVQSPRRRASMGEASKSIIRHWNYDRAAAGVLEGTAALVGPDRWAMAPPAGGSLRERQPVGY